MNLRTVVIVCDRCGAEGPVARTAAAAREAAHEIGWAYYRHTRGFSDACPVCAQAIVEARPSKRGGPGPRKKYRCGYCGERGHTVKSCPHPAAHEPDPVEDTEELPNA
jgi:hypothetical protein